ncbi:LUD domain-containing protein [Brachybacterium sp. GPGPB12]|uniref:LUD domain-containing protein n=2 Tax=Brachybacterium sp. GPGPB12 TaxID=3023517 RepID=UPI0031342FE0
MPDLDPSITDDPAELAEAARRFLREKFLDMPGSVAICGANFAVAETGTLVVVESEGNGRMCLTLPRTLISVVGIEKIVPTFQDLEVFLRSLPRSSTGERMNPYTTLFTGVHEGDGPEEFHLVLLDNGRSSVLEDPEGRGALHCIRCSACLNVCPVYARTGGHAYGSTYPGPIGAILSPQMTGMSGTDDPNSTLPYASSLCGACYDVCPVKIDIPEILVHLRAKDVDRRREARGEFHGGWDLALKGASRLMSSPRAYDLAVRSAKPLSSLLPGANIGRLPGRADHPGLDRPPRSAQSLAVLPVLVGRAREGARRSGPGATGVRRARREGPRAVGRRPRPGR